MTAPTRSIVLSGTDKPDDFDPCTSVHRSNTLNKLDVAPRGWNWKNSPPTRPNRYRRAAHPHPCQDGRSSGPAAKGTASGVRGILIALQHGIFI